MNTNTYFNQIYSLREKRIQKIYEIDDELFEFLSNSSKIYRATMSDILNSCIRKLLETQDLRGYKSDKHKLKPPHSFNVDESNVIGLGKLKEETNWSITILVSIAIRNVMEMEED